MVPNDKDPNPVTFKDSIKDTIRKTNYPALPKSSAICAGSVRVLTNSINRSIDLVSQRLGQRISKLLVMAGSLV
jgi:hypothetical protein